jgi:hypothetical protein
MRSPKSYCNKSKLKKHPKKREKKNSNKRNLKKNNGKKVFGTFNKMFIHILGVKKIFGKKWESLF